MDAGEWRLAFGTDRLTYLHRRDDQLPPEARRFLTEYGFPSVVIFEENGPFEISFAPITKPLIAYRDTGISWGDFPNPALDSAWAAELVIGEEEFCNGHAAHCVHRSTGIVTRIDIEIPNPQCFVNSSVRQFGESLLAAISWSQERQNVGTVPSDFVSRLADRIKMSDPLAFDNEDNFWPNLICVACEQYPAFWDVSCDPKKSRSRF